MGCVLDRVNSPADLKALDHAALRQLCSEIRELLVRRVTENGGHLASNLGVVELSVALHRVFHSPRDRIVWDVGHQSYVHKLLTGRKADFPSLRRYEGLSGFPDRDESPHDVFDTGHGGTSISAALGMALARDLSRDDYDVVAVIGDGCLSCGMAYEALNHAGHLGAGLIVLLNDNAMSISPTVGAMARRLHMLRIGYRYRAMKSQTDRLLSRLPAGRQLHWALRRLKEGAKAMVMPTMIWEQLGFTYVGPVDGHSIPQVETALNKARSCGGPVVVHVLTTKGKGYIPAEEDPVRFHGVSPLTATSTEAPTYSEVFARTVGRLLGENPRAVAITAAMMEGNGLSQLAGQFPRRIYDVGISEQHAVTLAAGLATQGFVPIVAIYSTFLQRAFDQVVHDVCLPGLPVVFALDRSGIVGEDGKTHQGIFDLSYLGLMPHMVVCAPGDENELQHLLYTAFGAGCPVAVRYPRGRGVGVPLDSEFVRLPIGRGQVVREGRDLTILSVGSAVEPSLRAAEILAAGGVEAWVVNARFIKPLDEDLLLETAARTGRLVTVEENVLSGGFGAAVLELLERNGVRDVKVRRVGLPDEFVPHGKQELLRSLYHLDAAGIAAECLDFLAELQPEHPSPLSWRGA